MKYKIIDGKKVSQISLGTVQLGMNYGIANYKGQPDSEQSFNILSAAFEQGITAVDTASAYGNSEEVLGGFFKQNKQYEPFVTTKYMSKLPDGASYNDIEKELFSSAEASLKKLNIDKIDCLLIHDPVDMMRHGNYLPRALEKILAQKLAQSTGVSVYTSGEISKMLDIDLYKTVQLPMNVFDRRLITDGTIKKLSDKKIHVFVRSVFFQGLFFLNPDAVADAGLLKYASEYIRAVRDLAQKENMDVAEFAIAYIRDIQGVTSLVLGADTREQVLENIGFVNAPEISAGTKELIEKELAGINIKEIMAILARPKK